MVCAHKPSICGALKAKNQNFNFFTLGFCVKYALKVCKKWPKNANFQFWINRPIRPIFMIRKLGKMSLGYFDPFPEYWTYGM